jgi:hypothetical protein
MRVVIESEEKPTIAPGHTSTEPSQIEAINGGPPAASLFQSATATTSTELAETGNFSEGLDAGRPPASLVQALRSTASLTKGTAGGGSDGGAAPNT